MKKHFLNFSIYSLWEKDSSFLLTNSVLDFSLKPLTLFLFFIYASSFGQEKTHTYPNATNTTTLYVPAGVVEMDVEAWGAGGAGGGANGAGVDGRSGAGGGGGAYAKRKITVSPDATLTMSAAPATTTSSANGGNSTIVGFESLIFAKGGNGGVSNTSGGNPAGGTGGLDTSSFGSERASGETGLEGHTGIVGLLFISGAGGKGGGTAGGIGGARLESGALLNENGKPGTAPGGGGSGGMNSSFLQPARFGGAGAEGRIIAKYTCTIYSITSVEALPLCASSGNAQITLRSTATNLLPAGVYTVSYTLGSPTATATTSMTVSTEGTGTFTISGLTTAGTRSITINKLDSGDCSSGTITTNNTTNIVISAASAGGTVSGGTTICSGATSAQLSLASNVGSVVRWESSVSPFSVWNSITNTGLTYTSGALTETTRFRAVVKNGPCDEIGSVYTTVTVNPVPQGNLTASSSFCGSGAGMLTWTSTGTVNGPYTIVYKENGGADRTATNVGSGTPFAVATTPVNVTTTYTLVSITGSNSCPRTTGFTNNSATITINPLPQGSLVANGPFCNTGAGQLTWTETGTATGPYTIIYKENGGANRTATNVASGTPFPVATSPVTTTTTYTLVSVTGSNSCPRTTGFTSGTATITINQGSAAPVVGTIVNPTCTVPTGSVVLNGLTGSGNILQNNGTTVVSVPFSGNTVTISGLAFGTYRFAVENSCSTTYTSNVVIQPNIWNGTSWSYGTTDPSLDDIVEFRGNYALNRNINACSCTVLSGFTVGVQTEKTLTVVKGVHVETGASLIFADGSNLLQTSTDNNLNTGNITYKRNSTPIRQADFVYWSSPVKSQSLYNVSPLTEDDKYLSYDGLQWVTLNSSELMVAGKGYIIRGPDTFSNTTRQAFSATFTGIPHNGNITGEATVTNRGYLIGNPYPSALSADDFINGNSVVGGTLYFWTHNTPVVLGGYYRYSSDDYATYNLTGGVGTGTAAKSGTNPDPDNNRSVPSGYIAAGQSFFAQAIGTGNIVFNNLMRRGGNLNSQFFKTSQEAKTTDIEKNRVWINMTNTEGAFKQILVGYIEGATNDYDRKYDGISFDGNKYLDFYSVNKTAKLVIQGRALPFKNTDIVPLGYRTTVAGEFTIALDHADGNMTIQPIFLEDKTTGVIHNLRSGNYTFTTETGTFADRFVLVYTDKTLGTDDFENPDNTIYVSIKDKIIKVDSGNEPIREVSVYSVNGSLLYTKKLVNATELRISELLVKSQILLVKVTLENNNVTTKKIIY